MANQSPPASLADRFMAAWRALEACLKDRWSELEQQQSRYAIPDNAQLLRWAEQRKLLTRSAADFLDSCRHARNAYAHVSFDDYAGPVALPPEQVVLRLERVVSSLRNPARITEVAVEARTCEPSTPLREALSLMHKGDFSQVPYRHDQHGWLLVTREQVARWLEAQADEDGMALVSLGQPVVTLADDPRVGPVIPRRLPASAPLVDAVTELEAALHTPDYPLVLVTVKGRNTPVRVLAVDDLPRAYEVLGR
ncbi:hypothetical protein HC028_00075 [Planosporangium flavigriseum]|uniref:CBS domain-containing protein n=1 Tax=Planosporangium flavigriseum TaxID=373681 RepID=A0A8J3LY28_9ACTN|nr:hypothetical protein [Planosporangium flavigriseum]NJC62922.1 hypothetical protein [Planosporangium flavigriseum]GIG73215.1 hypothetical protein Pfl04_16190 [Planosporangium flavigriseum]